MKEKILILGATGQVGQALVRRCVAEFQLDLPSHQALDFLTEGALRSYIADSKPNLVINCVAYNQVDKAEIEKAKANRINGLAVEELTEACAKENIPLIHFSTDYVFPGKAASVAQARYCESDATGPVNYYGHTKLKGELAARRFPANLVLRVSWVFSEYAKNMGRFIATQAQQGQPQRVATDQFGSPTYASHIASIVWQLVPELLAGEAGGLFHLSGDEAVSRYQLAQAVVDELKAQGKAANHYAVEPTTQAQWIESAARASAIKPANRPAFSALDSAKLAKRLGKPVPSWRQGITALIAAI